jgi:DNA-binding NtrC family response regulator
MKDLEHRIEFIARSGLPVLIEGASGTGKEALAGLLHDLAGSEGKLTRILCRRPGPVVYPASSMINGAADLTSLCRGAGGTVFLKNVHLLASGEQEQLLVSIEQAAGFGDDKDRLVAPPRLVSSSTESLEPLVGRGEFNNALYHRLSVYRICLPPLRERREDIVELFDLMVRRAVNGSGAPPSVTPSLLDALRAYDWPGNLRELQNIARTYVVTASADEVIGELRARSHLMPLHLPSRGDSRSLKEQVKGASQKLESEIILRTLERHRWNRRRAAQDLHISYRSLLYKMKSCNLRLQPQSAAEGK